MKHTKRIFFAGHQTPAFTLQISLPVGGGKSYIFLGFLGRGQCARLTGCAKNPFLLDLAGKSAGAQICPVWESSDYHRSMTKKGGFGAHIKPRSFSVTSFVSFTAYYILALKASVQLGWI